MFLVSRTLSRQHPFPMCGKRPAIASNNLDERPETTVETLIRQISGTANDLKYKISDGEQGWYRIKLAGAAHYQGMTSNYGGSEIVNYIAYLCPNTLVHLWNAKGSSGGTPPDHWDSPAREPSYAVFGASGAPESVSSGSQCGFGAGAGGYSPDSPVGGAGSGFVASLATCSEWDYCTHNNLICKTYYGYSRCPTIKIIVYGSAVIFTRSGTLDGDKGVGWEGFIPDPESSTGGTIAAVCYTQYRNPIVNDEAVVYYASDLTNPIATTSVEETSTESVFFQTTNPDWVVVGNMAYTSIGQQIGRVTSVSTTFGYRIVVVGGNGYSYDERAAAGISRQTYYAWRRTIEPGDGIEYTNGEIFWTNSATPQDCGKNGVFVYKKCGNNMCLTTIKLNTNNAVRVPELDTPGDRVVFGTTPTAPGSATQREMATNRSFVGLKDQVSRSTGNNGLTVSGSGAYLLLLSGGGGYVNGNTLYSGGAALGSITKYSATDQTGGYAYAVSRGPSDAFGANWGKNGASCVVDLNDMYAVDRAIASEKGLSITYNSSNAGYVEVYKISDSTDVTAYAQKIFFPASDRDYNVSVEINDSLAVSFEIKASIKLTERFVPGVKQGDVIIITLRASDDSEVISTHDITTETIAFGIFLDNAPWREREYTTTIDKQLGFAPGTYGALLVSGGGSGGYAIPPTSGDGGYPGCGGRGGSSDLQKIRFTVDDYCVAHIHVGAGGVEHYNGGEAGISGAGIGSYGGAGGEPTLLTFTKDVNVESMRVRLYSWTNGSSVMYTRNSVPNEPNKLTKFCDATGTLNGKTAYSTGTGNSTALVCQQDGLTYSNVSVSGNPNIDLNISGLVRCIFAPATGGGGGGGGMDSAGRLRDGGSGGGGGGWYRVDLENRHFYSVDGANGGSGKSGGQQGGVGNIIDGHTIVANRGQNGRNTNGKNGGAGYGAGGGAGGQGANDAITYAGKGGGGAPGDSGGAFGWWSNGATLPYDDMVPIVKYYEGKPLVYGMGGKGELKNNLSTGVPAYDAPRTNGNDGYLYIYSFSSVDEVIDAGAISSEITETIDCGTINGSIEQTINCDLL